MNNLSPITRAFLTVGIGVFIGILPVFMIINSLSTQLSNSVVDMVLTTPSLTLILLFGTIKRCVAKD